MKGHSRTMHLGNMGDMRKDGTQARNSSERDDLVLNTLGVVKRVATILKMEKIFTEI